MDEVGPGQCGHCGGTLPIVVGRGRSRARRARTPPAPARCSVRAGLGRCATRSTGAGYDQRGTVAAHTCAEHRELAGDLLRAGMPRKRTLDRWLPANVRWSPPQQAPPPCAGVDRSLGESFASVGGPARPPGARSTGGKAQPAARRDLLVSRALGVGVREDDQVAALAARAGWRLLVLGAARDRQVAALGFEYAGGMVALGRR